MIFWTFQRRELTRRLGQNGVLAPDFATQSLFAGDSKDAYMFLLAQYNKIFSAGYPGLVFGYSGYPSFDAVIDAWQAVGSPSGAMFPSETNSLLELDVPTEIGVLVVDFYRFSDLLFWSGQAAADDDVEHGLMNAKRQLLLPNVPAGYEFPVSHIPFLSKDWILKGICAK